MVRLNSTDSGRPSTPTSSASSLDTNADLHELDDVVVEDDDVEKEDLIPSIRNKGRKLSTETTTIPKRFKLRHSGYARLQCKENVERRLSGVKLQEMESVNMPLKAAKILVGNPMRLKMDNKEHTDSDEDTEAPISGHFDIVSVCNKSTGAKVRLPQLSNTTSLVQSSQLSATVLSSTDTQITMVLPRKAAKILLGDGQVKTSQLSTTSSITGEPDYI